MPKTTLLPPCFESGSSSMTVNLVTFGVHRLPCPACALDRGPAFATQGSFQIISKSLDHHWSTTLGPRVCPNKYVQKLLERKKKPPTFQSLHIPREGAQFILFLLCRKIVPTILEPNPRTRSTGHHPAPPWSFDRNVCYFRNATCETKTIVLEHASDLNMLTSKTMRLGDSS